jgi:uncharacterized protein (TIGR02266 family)
MPEKKEVLIICSTAAGQMYLGVLLNRIWYSPSLAKTAEEGLELARKTPFSLLLFDGDTLSQELQPSVALLRTDPAVRKIPLVLFLTNENTEMSQALLSQGCSAILTKPLDLAIVYGVLGRLSGQPRSAPRVPVRMQVEIEEDVREKELTCINISDGGLYLRTRTPLADASVIHISFQLPHDSEKIKIAAEVVRTLAPGAQPETEPGMGLRFLDITGDQLSRIRNYVQWTILGDLEWNSGI